MDDLLSNFEILFKARGLSAVHGRIFGVLVMAGKPLTQDQLAERSNYSVPAVSIALDELVRLGLVARTRKTGERKGYYQSDADLVKIFQKFIAAIHDEHVLPFARLLEYYVRENPKNKTMKNLQDNMTSLELYLQRLLEVKT